MPGSQAGRQHVQRGGNWVEGAEPVRPEAADGKSLPMEAMGSARA